MTEPLVATGSARRLGACRRLSLLDFSNARNPLKHWLFRLLPFSKKHRQNVLTTDLTTYGKWPKNRIFFTLRGVAQLVARDVWDVDAAGSNPVTPTKICALCTKKSVLFIRLGLIFLFIISNLLLCQKTTVFNKTLSFGTGHWFCRFLSYFWSVFWKSFFFAFCDSNFEGWRFIFVSPRSLSSSRQIGIYLRQ